MKVVKVCEICGKPKRVITDLLGLEINCACDCDIKAREEAEKIRAALDRMAAVQEFKDASLLGDRFAEVEFETTDVGGSKSFDDAFRRCAAYCAAADKVFDNGYGIYIYGENGTGKTHLAACIVNELARQLRTVIFTNLAEIAKMAIRDEKKFERACAVDFLVIDDLGAERMKNADGEDLWAQECIYNFINKRYIYKLPTIFTSNYSLADLVNECGMARRTVDRIAEMSNAVLKISGASRRLRKKNGDLPF